MSLCSNAFRAQIQCSRIRRPQTLLPFLYHTATIQQWSRQPRHYASSRPPREDSIPFEDVDGSLPPPVEDVTSGHKTTMTASERAAFEKLYKTFNTQGEGQSKGNKGEHEELDQIADEYWEDDEDGSGPNLDKVFEPVLQGSLRSQAPQPEVSIASSPSEPQPETPQSQKRKAARAEGERLKATQLEERKRIKLLFKKAQSDRELWSILEREVFDPVRKLDLDGTTSSKHKTHQSASLVRKKVLFYNYSHLLVAALLTLRHRFPTSSYPLMLLSTIKSLGRSSYALGASTILYRYLLRTAWLQQSSYTMIDTLLAEMDTNAIEFDAGILEFLDAVIGEHNLARSGGLGRPMQMVYALEQSAEGIQKIREWRKDIVMRLGVDKMEQRPHQLEPNLFERKPRLNHLNAPQRGSQQRTFKRLDMGHQSTQDQGASLS